MSTSLESGEAVQLALEAAKFISDFRWNIRYVEIILTSSLARLPPPSFLRRDTIDEPFKRPTKFDKFHRQSFYDMKVKTLLTFNISLHPCQYYPCPAEPGVWPDQVPGRIGPDGSDAPTLHGQNAGDGLVKIFWPLLMTFS